jgi:hypothetical protein
LWGRTASRKKEAVFQRLKLYDWTFSGTAELVVATLLAAAILSVIAFR